MHANVGSGCLLCSLGAGVYFGSVHSSDRSSVESCCGFMPSERLCARAGYHGTSKQACNRQERRAARCTPSKACNANAQFPSAFAMLSKTHVNSSLGVRCLSCQTSMCMGSLQKVTRKLDVQPVEYSGDFSLGLWLVRLVTPREALQQ